MWRYAHWSLNLHCPELKLKKWFQLLPCWFLISEILIYFLLKAIHCDDVCTVQLVSVAEMTGGLVPVAVVTDCEVSMCGGMVIGGGG